MSWTRGLTTINLGRVACSAAIAALLALPTSVRAQDEGDFDEEFDTPMAEFGSLEEPSNAFHAPVDDELAARTDQSDHSEAQVSTDEYELVDLAVNDEDLGYVLQMLALQSERNIVSSKDVSATVTANLFSVSFHEALDAILHVNGYGYIERGKFIYVYTLEELEAIEAASRKQEWRLVRLSYLNATDAAEFAKPLLSEGGQIKANGVVDEFSIPDDAPTGAEEFALTSTLLVFDFPEHLDEIESMLTALDTRPSQVLVEATILETALNEANAFGVDFALLGDLDFMDFVGTGGPLSVVDGLISGQGSRLTGGATEPVALPTQGNYASGLASTPGNTSGPSTFKGGVINGDFAAFLRMLDEVTDTTILSRPKILALNRQPARVLVGRKVGYLNTTATETSTTQSVEFLDTGTQLYFRPFISEDGMVRLELKPQVSEAIIRNATDVSGVAVTIPDELTNELVTNVIVRDGQTIVLGGLFKEKTTAVRRQVPFVGDIPIIGLAFRGNEDETQRSEIIFMITPTIVDDTFLDETAARASHHVEHVRAGARKGTLIWSRTSLTARLNLEAERAALEGDTDRALWKNRLSLTLNPRQSEAIALRERLTGKSMHWPNPSMLDEVINGEIEARMRRMNRSPSANAHPSTTPSSNDEAIDSSMPLTEIASGVEADVEMSAGSAQDAIDETPEVADAERADSGEYTPDFDFDKYADEFAETESDVDENAGEVAEVDGEQLSSTDSPMIEQPEGEFDESGVAMIDEGEFAFDDTAMDSESESTDVTTAMNDESDEFTSEPPVLTPATTDATEFSNDTPEGEVAEIDEGGDLEFIMSEEGESDEFASEEPMSDSNDTFNDADAFEMSFTEAPRIRLGFRSFWNFARPLVTSPEPEEPRFAEVPTGEDSDGQ